MRVLHLSSGGLFGGVETFLVTLATHRGACPEIEPHFALTADARLGAELREIGAPVHLLGPARTRNPFSVLRARQTLATLLGRTRFDVVVAHSPWVQALFGRTVRDAGIPAVFYLHGDVSGRHWLERWAKRNPPVLVICNSRYTAASLPSLYPGVRSELLLYPVASRSNDWGADERARIRAELGTPDDDVVIVQTSRLERWKGHRLHLEALGRLRDLPGWTSWQVGGVQRESEAGYLRELRELAADLGIAERVRFVGQRSDVPRVLSAADIHCQPNSGAEPFGIVFVEALYAGLPVVTTAMGGALEIVDESCGILTPPADVGALAEALRFLITDPARRAELAAAGPSRADALCSPPARVAEFGALLASVGNRSQRAAAG